MIILVLIGLFTGVASGFFGIGGGTILVPALLFYGFNIKTAIGISVLQMFFSSIYGSFLNYKKGLLKIKDGLTIGIGGVIGAMFSGYVIEHTEEKVLTFLFLGLVILSIYRFFHSKIHSDGKEIPIKWYLLILVGSFIGLFAISLGVGGSILLTPFLVGFLHYPLKKAVSLGLFFVVFSSFSGCLSLTLYSHIDYNSALTVALSSLLGVYLGIFIAGKTKVQHHKNAILLLYIVAFLLMLQKLF